MNVASASVGLESTRDDGRRRRNEQVLADLSLLALSEEDVTALFVAAAESAREVLGADFASVLELLPDREVLRLWAGSGWPPLDGEVISELGSTSPVAQAMAGDGPVLIDHARAENVPASDSLLGMHGVVSSAAMVIRGDERPFGAVSVHSRRPQAFIPADLLFLRALANILAAAIGRHRAGKMEQQLAAIVESSTDAIIGRTVDGVVTSWNAAAERLFGYSAQEMIGNSIEILAPPERQDELDTVNDQLAHGQVVEQFETVRVRKDGTRIHVASTVSPIKDSSGRIVAASAISRGIGERKRAEAALLESEARARGSEEQYRQLFESSPTPMWVFDTERLCFLAVNDAAVAGYGYSRDEFLARRSRTSARPRTFLVSTRAWGHRRRRPPKGS
jgi:PAS domain S-box-containing protein